MKNIIKEAKFAIKLEVKEGELWKVVAEDKFVESKLRELIESDVVMRMTTHCGEVVDV